MGNCLNSKASLLCYSYDATGQSYMPEIVVLPANTAEVSEIVKIANKYKLPVIPRGAGSGFAGGSVPVRSGIVIHLSRLNKIIAIDEDNLIAVVEPCVVTGVFQEEVEKLGLFYPPDPASLKFSTIGGNASTGAGGKDKGGMSDRHSLTIASFGHAGDGNLHVNIRVDKKNAEDMKRVEEAIKDIFEATVELEGAISGEHGVGISKAPYLRMQFSEAEIGMMREIKKALGPNNIMNPGKIFD